MHFPAHTIEQIRSAIDIVEIAGRYTELRQAGTEFEGLCPFHAEKTPSFKVSPSKQSCHCFGCKAGGDCFSLLMHAEGISFPEAVKRGAAEAGISLKGEHKHTATQNPQGRQHAHQRQQRAPETPSCPVPDLDRLLTFLSAARENIERPEFSKFLEDRGVTLEACRAYGVGFMPEIEFEEWPGWIIPDVWTFPILDGRGDVVAVKLHIENKAFRERHGKSRWAPFGTTKRHPDDDKLCHGLNTWWPHSPQLWFEYATERAAVMEFHGEVNRHQAEQESGWNQTKLYIGSGELKTLAHLSAGKYSVSPTAGEKLSDAMIAAVDVAHVVVVHDNDGPGRDFRAECAAKLNAPSIKAISWTPKDMGAAA